MPIVLAVLLLASAACEPAGNGPAIVLANMPRNSLGLPVTTLSIPRGVPGSELVGHGVPVRVLHPGASCDTGPVHVMGLEEYTLRVLACEMYWHYPGNSLAAQAISIRGFMEEKRCQGGWDYIAGCADAFGHNSHQVMALLDRTVEPDTGVLMTIACVNRNGYRRVEKVNSQTIGRWNRLVQAVKDTYGLMSLHGDSVTFSQYSAHSKVDEDRNKHALNQDNLATDIGDPIEYIEAIYGGRVGVRTDDIRCNPVLPDDMVLDRYDPLPSAEAPLVAQASGSDDTATTDVSADSIDTDYIEYDALVDNWGDSDADTDNYLLHPDELQSAFDVNVSPTDAVEKPTVAAAAAEIEQDEQAIRERWSAAGLAFYQDAYARRMMSGAYGTMESSYVYGHGSPYGNQVQMLFPVAYEGLDNSAAAAASCYPCNLKTVPKGCSPIGCSETVGGTCEPVGCVAVDTPVVDTGTVCVPEPEQCNGVDDDCDGTVDNGTSMGVGIACSAEGAEGQCAVGQMVCEEGALTCQPNNPGAEICDGLDNDCDGTVDNIPGGCSGDVTSNTTDAVEVCNGKDDNGDGFPDENNPGGGGRCNLPPTGGQVVEGTLACIGGRLECVSVAIPNAQNESDNAGGTPTVNTNEVQGTAWACSAMPGHAPTPPLALLLVVLGLALVRKPRS